MPSSLGGAFRAPQRIEYLNTLNTSALVHCSTALNALNAFRFAPFTCDVTVIVASVKKRLWFVKPPAGGVVCHLFVGGI